ncbi:MAG: hypothetical protein QM608_05700 [Caulobacter sp.]
MRAGFFVVTALAGVVSACAATGENLPPASERRIVGPEGYTVNWDLPETGAYWAPKAEEGGIRAASEACNAPLNVFVFHHLPRPPQFSYLGFRFEASVDDAARDCVVSRLKAVPSLTIYPKKHDRSRRR